MLNKRFAIILINAGILLLFGSIVWLGSARGVSAQCGTQASTCKDCHEVQGQDPVNADGTGWHQSHAFGDFCYICHAGNNTATDKDAAHTGMVAPLSDVKAACQQCHPKDLAERADVYAKTLGVEAGGLGAAAPTASASSTGQESAPPIPVEMCPTPGDGSVVLAPPAATVDYVALYNRNVLGLRPPDWGKILLFAVLPILVLVGLWFLVARKGWIKVSYMDANGPSAASAELLDSGILPLVEKLRPTSRGDLKRFLQDTPAAENLLASFRDDEGNTSED